MEHIAMQHSTAHLPVNLVYCGHCGKQVDVATEIWAVCGSFPHAFTVCKDCYDKLAAGQKKSYRVADLRRPR